MKVHVEEEYIRFTISGSDILVWDFIAIYNWTCGYTRDNLHLDLHHLAMIYLIQRSIYTLKEIKLENKELIYHTVLCSGVEPFSISESVGLLYISPDIHFPINKYFTIPTLSTDWSTQHFKVPQAYFTVIDKEMIYLTNELCIIVGMVSTVLLAYPHAANSKDQHTVYKCFVSTCKALKSTK